MLAHKLKQWSKIKEAVSGKRHDDHPVLKSVSESKVSISKEGEVSPPSESDRTDEDSVQTTYRFNCALNLDGLLRDSKQHLESKNPYLKQWALTISERLSLDPRLRSTLDDFKIIEEHPFLIEALTAQIFPASHWAESMVGVSIPFNHEIIYSSSSLAEIMFREGHLLIEPVNGWGSYWHEMMLQSYQLIAGSVFQLDLGLSSGCATTFKKIDRETGLETFFEFHYDFRYVEIHTSAKDFKLSERSRKSILKEPQSLSNLMTHMPPETFEFRGVMLVTSKDITKGFCLEQIRQLLRREDTFDTREGFTRIEQFCQNFFGMKNIDMGIVLVQGNRLLQLSKYQGDPDKLIGLSIDQIEFKNSIYHKTLMSGQSMTVDKSMIDSSSDPLTNHLDASEVERLTIIPLRFMGRDVGLLDLKFKGSTSNEHDLPDGLVQELQSIFSEELDRENQNFRISIQSVILEKYTAIHPSVEWAFRDAALKYVEQKAENDMAELSPIVFRGVYPLYGASDIRGSSSLRSKAIQQDLKDQVNSAKQVIDTALSHNPMPKLQEIKYRLETKIGQLTDGLMAGDEVTVLEFLNGEVETVFEAIRDSIPGVDSKIQSYRDQVDPDHGVFYKSRKHFDDSVTLLNEAIAAYYEEEQVKFQKFFPHYFEKQCTDGVDHTIYIGPPLVKDKSFHPIYLENIRIWQMMVICGAAYVADNLRSNLPVPLDLTHLIVLQDSSLSIRFSHDEKQFEVDGAYNIRYEIMKKRIDKATIKGSGERLTQPGKLAIVYSSKKERNEYLKYIDYLRAENYFLDDLEELEVEDLQGIQGLKAIRVGINIKTIPKGQDSKATTNLSNVVANSKRWLVRKRREMEDTALKVSETARKSSYLRKVSS